MEIYVHEASGLEFVRVPAGSFMMGARDGEGQDDARPRRKVKIASFLLCRTECTQGAFARVEGRKPGHGESSKYPVERISWKDAAAWCARAGFRLPSEAEWEYACRAGTETRFGFGDAPSGLGAYAWFSENSGGRAHPVGRKSPNAFGLFDMHGNVKEWCLDGWSESYEGAPLDGRARLTGGDSFRVHRGGGYMNDAEVASSFFRDRDPPLQDWYRRGFRPAVSLEK